MAYTNSDLVTYKNITKNKDVNRTHNIDTITIHCFVGQVTAKQGCDFFANTLRECSANYVVGYDGSIGLSVDEKDRSWCSSNRENDMRAITIEVASETSEPYSVTNKAYNALIKLLVDVCKRNNIKQLLWRNDKTLIGQVDKQNMTVHRWFANKSCPGTYLFNKMGEIADTVNAELNEKTNKNNKTLYRVQAGAFHVYGNAVRLRDEFKENGYDCFIAVGELNKKTIYRVQVGAFHVYENAVRLRDEFKKNGYDCFIVEVK